MVKQYNLIVKYKDGRLSSATDHVSTISEAVDMAYGYFLKHEPQAFSISSTDEKTGETETVFNAHQLLNKLCDLQLQAAE